MGGGSWSPQSWDSYATKTIRGTTTAQQVYKSNNMQADLNPANVSLRESCDGDDNPSSTAIIIALDVTGSMGSVLHGVAEKLGVLVSEIHDRKPITDPHIMFMAVGDANCDSAPLQVTQFEADIRIAEQLTRLYFEQGGGGNGGESYNLPYYFASNHTKIDCFEKRNKKGYLFTIGDENIHSYLTKSQIKDVFNDDIELDKLTTEDLLSKVNRQYEVFHLLLEQGGGYDKTVRDNWTNILGERAILVSDYQKIPEIIVSILQTMNGVDKNTIINSWDGTTSIAVSNAINSISASSIGDSDLVEI